MTEYMGGKRFWLDCWIAQSFQCEKTIEAWLKDWDRLPSLDYLGGAKIA